MASRSRRKQNTRVNQTGSRQTKSAKQESVDDGSTSKVIGLTVILTVAVSFAAYSYSTLPQPNTSTTGNEFSTANARAHLNAITDIGVRNAGSVSNDIITRDLILETISSIKKSSSNKVDIEVSLQNPSSTFYLDFLGGMTHVYNNLTNIAVQFNQHDRPVRHSLLMNCHFDSALGSPAASDDASSCAILLEILRCLSTEPVLLDHSVVFLFNGAEEMILPASHGFITQHPWAKDIRAFINLEAAGAGGKELVFQTGPRHPWIAKAYAQSVVYPYGSVFGEEVFQSGIIPGDTDFRIFRDFGGIPGIDMAYFINGYVYHTKYDLPEAIPDGSLQRAGENMLSMIKVIANSPYLANPGEEKHGKVIYFDYVGLFMVVYTHRVSIILNSVTALIVLLTLWNTGKKPRNKGGYAFVFKTTVVMLLSEAAAIFAVVFTALLTTLSGHSLSYYARPYLVIPLFYFPAILSMGAVHFWWRRKHPLLSPDYLDYVSSLSAHLLWFPLLVLTTYLGLSSSFMPFVWIVFPLLFWTLLWHRVIKPVTNSQVVSFICFSLSLVPVPVAVALAQCLHDLFVPITGRSGSEVLPDFIVGIMSGSLTCILGLNTIPVLVHYSKVWLLKTVTFVGFLGWFLLLLIVMLGLVFPYSARDPIAPKRLFVQHSRITHHHSDISPFTGLLIHPVDNLVVDPIVDASPYFKSMKEWPCVGIYCGIPLFIPVAHMIKRQWYMPTASPPVALAALKLESVVKTAGMSRNYTFTASFPNHGKLYIEPVTGMSLKSWSLTDSVPPLTPYGESRGCYYVTYVRGIEGKDKTYKFWIEIEGDVTISPSVEIAAVAEYLDPPLSNTPQLVEFISNLPDWVTCVHVTSTLDSWMF